MVDTSQAISRHGNSYCGPLVIAAVAGLTTGEAAAKVRSILSHRYQHAVKGMRTRDVEFVLNTLGHKTTYMGFIPGRGPTLRKWLEGSRSPWTPYLIAVTNHFVIIKGNTFCDTFTKGEWVLLTKAPHMRCRVNTILQIHNRE